MRDIHLRGGGYLIEGKKYNIGEAIVYLESIGFTKGEATEFLKSLPKEQEILSH